MSELPKGWAECSLEDLLGPLSDGKILHQGWSPQCESTPAPKGEWGVLKTTAVQDGYFLEDENKALPSALSPKPELEVKSGDLLMTCAGPRSRCGIICHVPKTREKLIFSGKIYRFRPNAEHVEPKFLTHLLRTAELKEKIDEIKTGISESGMNMTRERFFALPVRLAPLAEQTRIAQKLDELLAQVDTLKARIDAIPALLKRFRQSVLAAAVSGRLTEEWRAQNVGWVDEGSPTTTPASSSLPVGWSSKTAGDICGFITKGTTPSKEKMTAGHGEVPYIKVYNLTFTGALDFSIDPTFVDSSTHSTDLKRSIVKPGDVLMNIVGPPLGKVSIVPATYPEWNINQAIARFRAGDEISAAYLALCLRTEEVLSHAVSRAKATAGQFNLTLEICRELPLPVPPEEEQTEIVRRVEQLFAFADQLEAKVASAKSRIDHLTQSILAKAFRGELVPQDPNDEPASVLLERIKAQRAAAPKARRARKAP